MDSEHVGAKILIVDDDRNIAKALECALSAQGYETMVLHSGRLVLPKVVEWRPDLLMLDVKLPDIGGFELLSMLREEETTAATPVIMVTATGTDSASRVEGLNLGADDYIVKPYGLEELLARVASNLRTGRLTQQLEEMTKRLGDLASRDSLTGLYHHGKIMEKLSMEIYRATRYGMDLSCLMMDLDKFKSINDTYGHQVGDEIIVHVANILIANCRKSDFVGRYGGEEFLVIFTHTSVARALKKAESFRTELASSRFPSLPPGRRVTASIGVASVKPSENIDASALVKKADIALYKAKAAGGNRTTSSIP